MSSTNNKNCSDKLRAKIDEWMKWDRVSDVHSTFNKHAKGTLNTYLTFVRFFSFQNEKTRQEIELLDQQQNYEKLNKMLLTRLSFGTAGLRGVMQAGYNAMNDLVVIQSAQGLAKYIKKCFPNNDQQARGVVFGYDGRYNSKR